jgi:hypothetical protein
MSTASIFAGCLLTEELAASPLRKHECNSSMEPEMELVAMLTYVAAIFFSSFLLGCYHRLNGAKALHQKLIKLLPPEVAISIVDSCFLMMN